ncbi:MAG: FMN-binding protein [Oscillospiraceae bacterium]
MTATKKATNPIVRLTLILFFVSAVTAGILGLVNLFTVDRIKLQNEQATAAAYKEVMSADKYEPLSFDEKLYSTVNGVYKAGDAGYVVDMSFSGAQSTITAAIGIDTAGAVTGVSIIKHAETPSLGARAVEPEFRNQYVGSAEPVALTKQGGEIAAISGATITSKAVTDAVNTAMDVVASLG